MTVHWKRLPHYAGNQDSASTAIAGVNEELIMSGAAAVGYVLHLNLAWIAILLLLRQKNRLFIIITCVLVTVGTVQVVLRAAETVVVIREAEFLLQESTDADPGHSAGYLHTLLGLYDLENMLWRIQVGIFILNNIFTDGIFIYRCFKIWTTAKYVIFVPIGMAAATAALAIAAVSTSASDTRGTDLDFIPFATAALTNISLVVLTAGRVWWVRRYINTIQCEYGLQIPARPQYSLALMIILESGSLYCVSAITLTIAAKMGVDTGSKVFFYVLPFFAQFVNIIPILTFIHAGLGRNLEDAVQTDARLQSQSSADETTVAMPLSSWRAMSSTAS
ncbi:hypothetical protein MKEN_00196200 [Mycena kentingensis (nom. inval.)]|nr:hypothetical protein MKEN_00196200 [Mycena kentingensis (nom. inval.)]